MVCMVSPGARMCMVMPMMSQTSEKVVGILVAGVNPCHDLDENYGYVPVSSL